jgi:membrane protease YdiL (CAAX protease family)
MEQRMNNERKKEALLRILLVLAIIAVIGVEIWYRADNAPTELKTDLYNSLSRLFGTAVALVFMLEFSLGTVLHPLGNKKASALLYILPALAIAVNNFPWVSFLAGDCSMSASGTEMLFYAFMCLCVGLFEEVAFRGCVLMYLLKKRSDSKKGIFMSILWSSAVFGLIHLVNLVTDSPIAVILQIGYSTLIGALCSLVLLATKNIWLCVLLHATYNFVGNVIPRLGEGAMWTPEQMVFTAAVGVVVLVYCIWWFFFSMPVQRAAELYESK